MKIAITGHTQGIGRALTEVFPNHVGFSRNNGYDLNTIYGRHKAYRDMADCTVFVNNAPIGWNQIILLYELWDQWRNTENTIINIGSDAADYSQTTARPYSIQKKALQDTCLQMQQSSNSCRVMLIKPGYVDTPRVSEIDSHKIDPLELANYVKDLIENPYRTFWVPVITMYPKSH